MSAIFRLDRTRAALFDAAGRCFDATERRWLAAPTIVSDAVEALDAIAAVTWLQRESGAWLRIPIGVIGPGEATAAQLAAALEVGELLGDCRLTVICGGRQGVMQAVCEGVARVGGLALGRQFGKLVIGLEGAADLEGVHHVDTAREAVTRVAEESLGVT